MLIDSKFNGIKVREIDGEDNMIRPLQWTSSQSPGSWNLKKLSKLNI